MDENDSGSFESMVVFDGVKNGSPKLFKFPKDDSHPLMIGQAGKLN
jgi:hypothetical protein